MDRNNDNHTQLKSNRKSPGLTAGRLAHIINHLPGGVLIESRDRKVLQVNRVFCEMFAPGTAPEALEGADCRAAASKMQRFFVDGAGFCSRIEEILNNGQPVSNEALVFADGRIVARDYIPVADDDGYIGHLWHFRDITESSRAGSILAIQSEVLEMIALGADLPAVLTRLCLLMEKQLKDAMCSILLYNPKTGTLHSGVAPGLPADYARALNGLLVGEGQGSCGTAVSRGKPVYVHDIASDPLWAKFRDLALQHGIRSCWSAPFFSKNQQVLGTFAISHTEPRSPESYHLQLIQTAAHLASIATERKQWENALRQSEKRLIAAQQLAKMGDFTWDIETGEVFWSDALYKLLQYEHSETIDYARINSDIHHPDDRERITKWLNDNIASDETVLTPNEYRIVRRDGETMFVRTNGVIERREGKAPKIFATVQDITERRRAEERIARFGHIFEDSLNEIFLFDAKSLRFTQVNTAAQKNLGYTTAELLALTPLDIKPDFTPEMFEKLIAPLRSGEKSKIVFETVHKRKDQSLYHVEVHLQLLQHGNEDMFAAIILDITDRKKTEEALSKSEERLNLALKGADLGLWDWHVQSGTVIYNERWAEMLGYTLDEIEPHVNSWEKLVHPDDMPKIRETLSAHLAGETPLYRTEHRMRTKEGNWKWVLDCGRVFERDKNGKPLRATGIHLDITDRKNAEQIILENEHRLRSLINSTPDIICFKDGQGRWLEANNADLALFGLTEGDYRGKTDAELAEFSHRIYRDAFLTCEKSDETAWQAGCMTRSEEIIPKPDGSQKIFDVIKVPLFEPDGSRKGLVVLGRDITEQKKHEQRIQNHLQQTKWLQKTIEKLNRAQNRDEIFKAAGKGILKILKADRYAILLFDENEVMHFRDWHNLSASYRRKAHVHGPWRITETEAQPQMIPDISDSEMESDLREIISREGIRAMLFVPLKGQERLLGKIMVYYNRPHTFSEEEQYFAQVIAQNLAAVLTRQNALENTLHAERMYRSIFANAAEGIYQSTPEGRFITVNPAMVRLFGYQSAAEMMAISNTAALYWDDGERKRLVKMVNDEGQMTHVEVKMKRSDGEPLWVLMNDRSVKDASGKTLYYEGTLLDITERKKAEEALRESEEMNRRLATLVEQASESIVVTDMTGQIEYVNPAFEKLTGYTAAEVLGKNPRILKSGKQDEQFYKNLWEALHSGDSWNGKFVNKRKDSSIYYEEAVIFPIKNSAGKIVNLCKVGRDVSREQELEQQLRQAQKLETIGTLAGGIAHDFNNILAPIMGYSDMALSSLAASDPLYQDLKQVLKGAKRGKDLVEQILLFSKEVEKERTPLHLHPIVKEALKLLRPSIPASIGIKQMIDTSCDKIKADASQMHQVIINLCTNGWQAMEDNGGLLTVELKQVTVDAKMAQLHPNLPEGEYLCLSVSDTGIGMDEKTRERIFEPFFTTKAVDKGTGLGLSVVHGIVRSHQGEILVESFPGKGSSFYVYLPVIKTNARGSKPAAPKIKHGKESILVVDDNESIADMMEQMLTRLGYRVEAFYSSPEALRQFAAAPERFDLMISDLTMPTMTGLELSEQMQKVRSGFPVLIMTGYGDSIAEKARSGSGIKQVLAKPIMISELAPAIRKILDEKVKGEK